MIKINDIHNLHEQQSFHYLKLYKQMHKIKRLNITKYQKIYKIG